MIVRETLNFERGQDPKRSMSIGRVARIKAWFDSVGVSPESYTIDKNFNIRIIKDLFLSNTPLTSLPEGLSVGRNLYLNNTQLTSLPEDLVVKGRIFKDF